MKLADVFYYNKVLRYCSELGLVLLLKRRKEASFVDAEDVGQTEDEEDLQKSQLEMRYNEWDKRDAH